MENRRLLTRAVWTGCLVISAALWAPPAPARAFSSFDKSDLVTVIVQANLNTYDGYVHGDITRQALAQEGSISLANTTKVVVANWHVDWDKMSVLHWEDPLNHWLQPCPIPDAYQGPHHFDRPDDSDYNAFVAGLTYLMTARQAVTTNLTQHETDDALKALGQALHAGQDFFAHSNYVDLTSDQQAIFMNLLLGVPDSSGDFPTNFPLWLTGFGPNCDQPGPHPHDNYCKDNPRDFPEAQVVLDGDGTTTITKFDAAKAAAVQWSQAFVKSIRDQVTAQDPTLWDPLTQ